MNYDPMEHMIESATKIVEEEGYLRADDKAVQLAAFGFLVRHIKIASQETRDHIDIHLSKTPQKKIADGVKTTGIVGILIAAFEAVKTLLN